MSTQGWSPGRGHVLLHYMFSSKKLLNSHSVSLYPGVLMATGKFNAGGAVAVGGGGGVLL